MNIPNIGIHLSFYDKKNLAVEIVLYSTTLLKNLEMLPHYETLGNLVEIRLMKKLIFQNPQI